MGTWWTRCAVRAASGAVLGVGLWLPASAECLGACADRLSNFLMALLLSPVLLIALFLALYLRRRRLAVVVAAALLADLGVLAVYG